jgi:hypothetical protein
MSQLKKNQGRKESHARRVSREIGNFCENYSANRSRTEPKGYALKTLASALDIPEKKLLIPDIYNLLADLGQRLGIPFETETEKALKLQIAEKDEEIKILKIQLQVYKERG